MINTKSLSLLEPLIFFGSKWILFEATRITSVACDNVDKLSKDSTTAMVVILRSAITGAMESGELSRVADVVHHKQAITTVKLALDRSICKGFAALK